MKRLLTIFTIISTIVACNPDQGGDDNDLNNLGNPSNADDLGELNIPKNFNWSSSFKGLVDVNITSDTAIFSADSEPLLLVDANNNILDRQIVNGSSARFYLSQPQLNTETFLYYPNTGDRMKITHTGNTDFDIKTNFFNVDYQTLLNNVNPGNGKKSARKAKTAATNLIVNGDFESSNNFSNTSNWWNVSAFDPGKWYIYNNKYELENANGGKVFKSKHNSKGLARQRVSVNGGDLFTVSGNTSGDFCIYVFYYTSNYSYIGYNGWAPGSNGDISASGTIPQNAAYAVIKIHGPKNHWIDNVTFSVDPPVTDSDNDGVNDDNDDYPNDNTKAYQSFYPTSGYQTVAFEDLWPEKGDYDFNDMVLSNQTEYAKNANNNWVDAKFTITVDGVGAGYHNGLAIVFTDGNKQPISQNIIASVSGDASLDPNVNNGIIVFNDVYAAQTAKGGSFYNNNGSGPSRQPDTFTFTVTFNNNAGSQILVPDIYIFRTSDRGLEVHLDGFGGTSAANPNYYNTGDDINGTYKTETGLPWGLEVITPNKSYKHPLEKVNILVAYPQFQGWAESSGNQNQEWLANPVGGEIFDQF